MYSVWVSWHDMFCIFLEPKQLQRSHVMWFFFRGTLQMTRDLCIGLFFFTLQMTWEFAFFGYVRQLPCHLQVVYIYVYSIHIITHRYDRYVSSFHDSRVLSYFHKLDGWLCIPDEVFQHAVRVDPKWLKCLVFVDPLYHNGNQSPFLLTFCCWQKGLSFLTVWLKCAEILQLRPVITGLTLVTPLLTGLQTRAEDCWGYNPVVYGKSTI